MTVRSEEDELRTASQLCGSATIGVAGKQRLSFFDGIDDLLNSGQIAAGDVVAIDKRERNATFLFYGRLS